MSGDKIVKNKDLTPDSLNLAVNHQEDERYDD